MSETLPPLDDSSNDEKNIEAALAAALAKPHNPIDDAHREARAAEDFLNEYFDSLGEDGEVDDMATTIADVMMTLDEKCDHMQADVVVTGLVRSHSLDHRQIENDDSKTVTKEAVIEKWVPVDRRIATSLGYYALYDSDSDRKLKIYHGVRTQLEPIAQSREAGGIYKTNMLYLPIDGTASAELQFPPREVNYDLLEHYLSEDLLYDINAALYNSESTTDAVRQLGKINLKNAIAIDVDDDVRYSLNEHVNRALDFKTEILYEISGASFVEYEDDDGNTIVSRLDPKASIVGHIHGVGVDTDSKRFRLVAEMPFNNDTVQYISYRINSQLTIKQMPAFTFSTTSKLRVR